MDNNLAVLIDFENIAAGTEKEGLGRFDVELVLARLSDKGRILISRSYADWGRFARFKQGLLTNNVSMMELTSHGMHDKNRADIAMVVEGMELAFTKPYVDTFVIVSGDSDFTPMVLKMRELDKRVIGVGCRSSTSRLLIQACDEFIFYDNLAQRRSRRKQERKATSSETPTLQAAFDLLLDAVEGLQREHPEPPLAGRVKTAMLRKSPDFSEGDLGFSSFTRFLEKAQKQGVITMQRDEKSGGFRVDQSASSAPSNDEKSAKPRGNANRSDDSVWLDPYLPKGARPLIEALAEEGLNPLAAPTRKTVLQAVEEAVAERSRKRRRVTVQFVQEDVQRALKRTHPDLPIRGIRHVFNALMRAGVFIHRDGTPVRTGSAPFTLDKTAEELNETLADIYVDELHRSGLELSVPLLAELFFGAADQSRPIEESLAYLQATTDDDGEGADDDGDEDDDVPDLDPDLLLVEEDELPASEELDRGEKTASKELSEVTEQSANASEPADAAPPKKKASKNTKKPKSADKSEPSEDEPKPKAKAKAKAKPKKKADVVDEELTAESSEESEDPPKRRRTRRRTPAKDKASEEPDLDTLLTAD